MATNPAGRPRSFLPSSRMRTPILSDRTPRSSFTCTLRAMSLRSPVLALPDDCDRTRDRAAGTIGFTASRSPLLNSLRTAFLSPCRLIARTRSRRSSCVTTTSTPTPPFGVLPRRASDSATQGTVVSAEMTSIFGMFVPSYFHDHGQSVTSSAGPSTP